MPVEPVLDSIWEPVTCVFSMLRLLTRWQTGCRIKHALNSIEGPTWQIRTFSILSIIEIDECINRFLSIYVF